MLKRKNKKSGELHAKAKSTGKGFVLLKGSRVLMDTRSGIGEGIRLRREDDLRRGVLKLVSGQIYELTEDQLFTSPSAAGRYVVGGSINGRTEWKTRAGRPLKDIEGKDS